MTAEQRHLVEGELCFALKAFQDIDDEKQSKALTKKFFWDFCQKHKLDPQETFSVVKIVLEAQPYINDYSDYTDTIKLLRAEIRQKEQKQEEERE